MKIPSSIESQGIHPGFQPGHAQKMFAMAHAHATHLAAAAKVAHTQAVASVGDAPTTEQVAYAIQGYGDLAAIDSLVQQYNTATTPAQKAKLMADIVWYAQDLLQNCLPNADPAAAAIFNKMAANFTYTIDPTTGKVTVSNMTAAQIAQFVINHEMPSGVAGAIGSDEQAWLYISAHASVLSQSFSTQYPLAALGLFMLSCDNFIIPAAMQGEDQHYHNGKGPLHYDDWFLNQNWDSTMNYGQLFPYMILTAAYLACCSQSPPYSSPSQTAYTAMISRFQDALPPVSLTNIISPPPETTYYQQMLNNLSSDISNQDPSHPFMHFPSPPFGPIQGLTFGQNPYNPNDPSYQSFDPVYESFWQDLQAFYTQSP